MKNMQREEALNLLKQEIKTPNLIKHSLAVEAAMRALARFFQEDEEKWGVCGLLHDIDYEKTKDNPNLHSKVGAEMLKKLGFDEEICQAILAHNSIHNVLPETKMAKALSCVDPLTGLIVAATLVLPSKKIKDLKVENVLNRFKEKSFARGADREEIKKCQEYLNLSLEKFIEIVLEAMQKIDVELGL
jgi:putative nucleotidyltransferase with HDIG domain